MTTCQKMPTMSSAPVTYRSDYFFSDSPQSTATVESQTLSEPESHARSLSNLPDLHELTNLPSLPNLPNIFFLSNLPRLPDVVVTSSTWHVLLNQPTNHPTAHTTPPTAARRAWHRRQKRSVRSCWARSLVRAAQASYGLGRTR